MPIIAPFKPFRYNEATHTNLGMLVAPPYDVISEDRLRKLRALDPHNVIRIILPDGGDGKYENAGRTLADWIVNRVLVQESAQALYAYRQHFTHPETGQLMQRAGFVGLMKLADFSEGIVLPHERTLSGPKADRLKLMRATMGNVEAIFGMYADSGGSSSAQLADVMSGNRPIIDVTDPDGVAHAVWRVSERAVIESLQNDLHHNHVVIVDGHHRYETALQFQRESGATGTSATPDEEPADWIMTFLAPSSDPGMLILPTHRVVHSIPEFTLTKLLASMRDLFAIEIVDTLTTGAARLAASADRPTYLLLHRDAVVIARLNDAIDPTCIVSGGTPRALAELDVTILHEVIFEQLLEMSREAQEEQRNLRYVKSSDEAFSAAADPATDLVVMMNPPTLSQVDVVAASGMTMPQKSTYFYPKLASGLLFNRF